MRGMRDLMHQIYIGMPSRLVHLDEALERKVDPDFGVGYKFTFSDRYPFMLLSQGSVDELNELLKDPVPVKRFRPNIVVDGCEAFVEDLWKKMKVNELTFLGVQLCSLCEVPNVNQENGVVGSEPMKTLKKNRSDKVLFPSRGNNTGRYILEYTWLGSSQKERSK